MSRSALSFGGLDLRGGAQIVLQAKDGPTVKVSKDVTDRTLEVLRRRVDQLRVSEPALTRSGNNRIIVELPGVNDPQQALSVIGRTAQLSFHPVLATAPAPQPTGGTTTPRTLPDESGQPVQIGPTALTGNDVSNATAMVDTQSGGGWQVSVDFRGGGDRWATLTGAAACNPPGEQKRRVAIVLDGKDISSPQVAPDVACRVGIAAGATTITGQFTEEEAKDLGLPIRAGAAGTGGRHRAAHRGPDPRRERDPGQRGRGDHRRHADQAVSRHRVPLAGVLARSRCSATG